MLHLSEDRDLVAETLLGRDGKFWIVLKMSLVISYNKALITSKSKLQIGERNK